MSADLYTVLLPLTLQSEADRLITRGAGLSLQHQPQPSQHQRVVKVGPKLKQEYLDFEEFY